MKIAIHSAGQGHHTVEDFSQLKSKNAIFKLPNGQPGFRGSKLGASSQEGSQPEEVLLESALIQTKLLTSIKVFHDFAIDGVEFLYEDSTSQLFGKRGGKAGGSEFMLGKYHLPSPSFLAVASHLLSAFQRRYAARRDLTRFLSPSGTLD